MKNKAFDCVEMKHSAAAKILSELEKMTPAQKAQYWRRKEESMVRRQDECRARVKRAS